MTKTNITIDFIGICTHFRDGKAGGVPHRVVCVDGRSINDIKPHFVTLSVFPDQTPDQTPTVSLTLGRQHVRLYSGADEYKGPLNYDREYSLIPNLATKVTPSDDVIVCGRGARVFFDLRGGAFGHLCNGEAHACRVEVTGIEVPTLHITSFDDRFALARIRVPDGGRVALQHTEQKPMMPDDDNSHFRLHYLVSGRIPDPPVDIPEKCTGGGRGPVSLNVGCSNSTFP